MSPEETATVMILSLQKNKKLLASKEGRELYQLCQQTIKGSQFFEMVFPKKNPKSDLDKILDQMPEFDEPCEDYFTTREKKCLSGAP